MFPKVLVASLLLLIGTAAAFFVLRYNFNAEVCFRDFSAQDVVLNDKQALVLDDVAGDPVRKALIEFPRGKHVIDYDVHAGTRYYTEFDIKNGENFIKPYY